MGHGLWVAFYYSLGRGCQSWRRRVSLHAAMCLGWRRYAAANWRCSGVVKKKKKGVGPWIGSRCHHFMIFFIIYKYSTALEFGIDS